MKIKIQQHNKYWRYDIVELGYTQEEYCYIFKYLDFDKLEKKRRIYFNNEETDAWFKKTYINNINLETIYKESPEGYKYLKQNWRNGVFKLWICYQNKQDLKTVVNKVINIRLIRGE